MDDKIKAYVKNNIRKTAQTYLKIAKQPIEQAKFIGSVGREVAKAPAFLGKTAATGLIKIPTQVATNGRVDLAKNKYIGKAFMTDKQINQVSATPTAPLKFLGQNVLAGAKTAATAFGAPAMATRQGLTSLGASSLLGGGLNKAMGQDARQGAVQGAALAPTIAGITRYSNPLIEQGVAKFAPWIAGKMPNIIKEGIARVPGNVIEGAAIDATLGRRPLSLGSAAIDAATSFIPGGPNIRNRKQQLDNVDVVKPWQKAFNAAKDNKVADKLIMTIRGYETIKKAGGTTKQFESVFREASEFFLPEKARNLPLDEQVNVWKYILNRHAGSSIDVDVPQILKDVDMMYRPQSLGLGIVEDGKLKNNPQPNVANSLLSDIDGSTSKINLDENDLRGINEAGERAAFKLSEILDLPDLYKRYPELKELDIEVSGTRGNVGGSWDGKKLTLSATHGKAEFDDSLFHELQHIIQEKEGLPRGSDYHGMSSSPEYQKYLDVDGEKQAREAGKNRRLSTGNYIIKGEAPVARSSPPTTQGKPLLSDIKSKKFVPSTKWQEVPEGTVVPPGGTYKMNMATGKTEAKWDNPPPTSPPKVKVKDSKYAFNINKNRLNMNKGQTKAFEKQVKQALPELEKVKGKKLTFDEVTEEAQKADLLKKAVGRESTANFEAQLTATRNRMLELNKQIDNLQKTGDTKSAERLTLELIQHIKSVSGAAADTGRRLGSFRITAEARPFREQLLGEIIKNQKYSDDQAEMLVKAAAGVDFNDPTQVSKFFKEVIKPSIGKMLEEYRYINLLSSPRTHITNIFSNAIQTGVLNPATKLTTGIVDPIASVLTGKARENYIGEVPMYYRGMFGSFPDAFTSLKEVFQGKRALTNLDFKTLQRMPSKANVITKSLEGFDVFFRTLIEGGEKQALDYKFGKMGKEAGEGVINNIAEQRGQYYTFRQGFDNPGQGAALDWFDKGTQAVMQLRRVPGVSWFVPFIQTPMNIVKQGFEYSPAGFSTMAKADNKTEQFSKALLGSAVFAGAGYLALNDRLTYAAPRDPEQKKLFYASGKQPYSVKVGDKWVSFSKIGPLAYPLALAGAIKYSFEDNPSAITDDTFEKTTKALTGAVGFFADQSYMQGIGNMIKALEGQEGFNFSKIAGNVATQYVPLASLQRWVNNIIDPIYRKPKTFVDNIKSSVIGQTGDMGYYEDPLGEPSKRQFPLQNAFSPVGITQENPEWNPLLDMRQQELQGNAILNKQEKNLQEKVGLNPASADSGDTKMDAYTAKMQEKMARNRVELLGESERIGDKIIYQTESGTGTLDLGKVTSLSEDNKYLKAIKNSKAYTLSGDILDADISEEEKNQALKDIGISRDDAEYYSIASQSNDLKSIYLLEVAQAFVNNSGNRQDMIDVLVSQRRKVNGDMIASDGVLDNLYNDGYITNEERKALKDIDFDAEGKLKVKPSSGGKKLKAVKAPTYKLSRKARQKLRKPKLASIKLEGSKKLKTTKPKKFAPIKLVNSKK